MKKKTLIFAAIVLLCIVVIYKWRNPPLKMPTNAQVQGALPNGSQAIFDGADKFVLYSLDPHESMKNMGHKTYFHEFGILGETAISDKATMQRLRESFYDGITNDENMMAACFNPRHGLRAIKNGKNLDFLICFECGQEQTFFNGKSVGRAEVNRRPQNTFDRIYTDAGLKMEP